MANHAATVSPTTMVDDDDGPTKRETHYNNQRSSLRSSLLLEEPSVGPRSRSRSQSQTHNSAAQINDYDLLEDIDPTPPSRGSTASPAPNIPYARDRHRIDSGSRWKDRSSSKHTSRTTTNSQLDKAHEAGDLLVPGSWLHVYAEAARAPDSPASLRKPATTRHNTEADAEHVTPSPLRAHPASALSLPPQHLAPNLASTSQLSITALPSMSPEKHDDYADLYLRSKPTPEARRASRLVTELYTVSYLIFFSIWGTLARIGLQALTFYSGTPLTFSELWANVAGTLVMGFLAEDRRLFAAEWGYREDSLPEPLDEPARRQAERARHGKVKKTIPMYIGLATGFCGSFTSFSSFIRDVFLALSNDLKVPISHPYPTNAQLPPPGNLVPRNGGYSFLALCATIIITIATCYCALHVGAHLAIALDRITPTPSFRLTRRIVDPVFVFLGWGVWIGAVVMAAIPPKDAWRSQALFACVFAPVGCLLRYYISLYLNPINLSFPVGTFTVNVFGTAVIGMAYDLQHVSFSTTGLVGGGVIGCQVLQGIMDGFCGCLTTVSTWIVEIDALKRKAAYVYASLSVVTAFSLLLIIMGSVTWTVGWEAILCST